MALETVAVGALLGYVMPIPTALGLAAALYAKYQLKSTDVQSIKEKVVGIMPERVVKIVEFVPWIIPIKKPEDDVAAQFEMPTV